MFIALPTIVQVTLVIMHHEIITTRENCDIVDASTSANTTLRKSSSLIEEYKSFIMERHQVA